MDAILRAELKCLRATWSTMTARLGREDSLATPAKIAAQLLDRLIVDADGRSELRARLYDAVSRSIPSIHSSLAKAPDAAQPLAELESATKAGAGDESSFQRWCKALAALQSRLAMVDDARVRAEVKALAAAEGGYSHGLLDASAAQERRSAQTAQPSASHIRNTREIDRAALLRFLQASFPQETTHQPRRFHLRRIFQVHHRHRARRQSDVAHRSRLARRWQRNFRRCLGRR
jgi:hypothetical protein